MKFAETLNKIIKEYNLDEEVPVGAMSTGSGGSLGTWTTDTYGGKEDARMPTGKIPMFVRYPLAKKKKKLKQ
jgi:hypothetical protein